MFNVLVTADIHIHDYLQNNIEPDFRLFQFNALGQWFTDIIAKYECKAVIIAGDFFNVPSPRPKVVEVGAEFLSLVSSYAPIYITHGQHDIDVRVKSDTFQHNTLLKTIQRINKKSIHYLHREDVLLNAKRIYFNGYDNEYPKCDNCDIYVTHAFMNGATMPGSPYPISKGVELETAPLVIAGDIHKYQAYDNVLIPGPPLQHSFKDDPDTGVIILDLDSMKYHRIASGYVENRHNYSFMTFTYEDVIPDKPDELKIVKLLPQKKEEEIATLKSEIVTELNPLKILEDNISDDLKDIHVETVSTLAPTIFPSLSFNLKSIKLQNFLHFEKLEVDFTNFGKFALVIGENGSGKTSFFSSILFALKGGNGREYSIKNAPLQVILELDYEGSTYQITRYWYKSENVLKFTIDDELVDFSGINAGNQLLKDHLPFIEYLDLLYMNQQRAGFLSTYTLQNRIGLLNKICNIEIIDLVRVKINKRISTLEEEINNIEITLQTQQNLKKEASEILSIDTEPEKTEQKSKEDLLQAKSVVEGRRREFSNKRLTLQRQKDDYMFRTTEAENLVNQYINESQKLEAELKEITENICPTCKQPISDIITIELRMKKQQAINDFSQKMQDAIMQLSQLQQNVISDDDIIACENEIKTLEEHVNILIDKLSIVEAQNQKEESRKRAQETLSLIDDKIKLQQSMLSENNKNLAILKKYNELVIPGGVVMNLLLTKLSEKVSSDFLRVKVYKELVKKKEKRPDFTLEMYNDKYDRWVKYDNLSGGERTVADLWWLGQIYDLTNGVGIVLLDETFKFLDKENLEKCVELVKNMNYGRCFVVSHEELFPDYDTLIKFDKAELELL